MTFLCCLRKNNIPDEQYFHELEDLVRNQKAGFSDKISELFEEHSDNLIADLMENREHSKLYQRLSKTSTNTLKTYQQSFRHIQKIATNLNTNNYKNLNKISEEILNSEDLSNSKISSILCRFSTLTLDDLYEIKRIEHPLIKKSVMATLINRDKLPLSDFQLSKKEILEICPLLTYLDARDTLESWTEAEIYACLDSCKNLKTLIISSNKITRLPNLDHCEELFCMACINLKELPKLTKCHTLDCSGCISLEKLPPLPQCQALSCEGCETLTALPILLKCQSINCSKCLNLTQIKDAPSCLRLNCEGCINLKTLPSLYVCEWLNCSECNLLTKIEALPQCQFLDCSKCKNLSNLVALPNCEELKCKGCSNLFNLPPLDLCERLNCKNCVNLIGLPELPKCKILNCEKCIKLKTLPELLLSLTVICKDCQSLTKLSSLRMCETLDCSGCVKLIKLPDMRFCNKLNYDGCEALNLDSIPSSFKSKQSQSVRRRNMREEKLQGCGKVFNGILTQKTSFQLKK